MPRGRVGVVAEGGAIWAIGGVKGFRKRDQLNTVEK